MDKEINFLSNFVVHTKPESFTQVYQHMRIVIQRVKSASVDVNGSTVGKIQRGLLLLAGIHETDSKEEADWCCRKIRKLRIFEDEDGKMNRSVTDIGGGLLVISQFTLYGNTQKGNRPSFIEAAKPDLAEPLYDYMVDTLKKDFEGPVETGTFGAMMDVSLINDGPVTLVMER